MAPKPIAVPLSRAPEAEDLELAFPRVLEPFLRRLAGDGIVNLLRARAEVEATLDAGAGALPQAPPPEDALPAEAVPSVARGSTEDRVLAEIDQEGFAFALDPLDAQLFNRRPRPSHRQQNLIDIALIDGRVCIRKRVRGLRLGARRWGDRRVPAREWLQRGLWSALGLYLYTEAAALLRLSDLPFIPRLRRIDFTERSLYVDYIQGDNLRNLAARGGAPVYDADVKRNPRLSALSARELERREVELLDGLGAGDFRREIARMSRETADRGVAPLDVKLGNFIRGARTGQLYWIDFELSRLQSQPRWEVDLAVHRQLLEELFGLSSRGRGWEAPSGEAAEQVGEIGGFGGIAQ